MSKPGDSVEGKRGAAPVAKWSRTRWTAAGCAVAAVATLYGVQRWRVQQETAAITQQRKETERRLEQLKVEFEAAKAEEERLKRRLDKVRGEAGDARKKADDAAKENRSPPYFDLPGWRNDTGEPRRNRVRPLPVDPSQRRPEERGQLP